MIEVILMGVIISLQLITLIVALTDSEKSKLARTVEIKKLRLSEKALDIQMDNATAMVQNIAQAHEQQREEGERGEDEEERTPIGFTTNNPQ